MKRVAGLFAVTALALAAACSNDTVAPSDDPLIQSGAITADIIEGGVRIANGTSEAAAFHVRNPHWLGLLAQCQTPDLDCVRLLPGMTLVVPNDEVYGYSATAPIEVNWWRVVRSGNEYRASEIHTITVR